MAGTTLTQWDSLKEEEKIVEALSVNEMFVEFVAQAKSLLRKSVTEAQKPGSRKRKRRKLLTEADAAEQERLLAKSKEIFSTES